MKAMSVLIVTLALVSLPSNLAAQKPKANPWSRGYVGKTLPELKGHEGSDSRWLGKAKPVSLKPFRGKVALVVFTSLG